MTLLSFVYYLSNILSDGTIISSGLIGYPSDDINKFLWMVRIGGGVFPHIKEADYLVLFLFPWALTSFDGSINLKTLNLNPVTY